MPVFRQKAGGPANSTKYKPLIMRTIHPRDNAGPVRESPVSTLPNCIFRCPTCLLVPHLLPKWRTAHLLSATALNHGNHCRCGKEGGITHHLGGRHLFVLNKVGPHPRYGLHRPLSAALDWTLPVFRDSPRPGRAAAGRENPAMGHEQPRCGGHGAYPYLAAWRGMCGQPGALQPERPWHRI